MRWGKILDGRNRYNACLIAGVEPRFVEWSGGSPLEWVVSDNLVRRHLLLQTIVDHKSFATTMQHYINPREQLRAAVDNIVIPIRKGQAG